MTDSTRVLVIEDNRDHARLIEELLYDGHHPHESLWECRLERGLCRLDEATFDIVLLDLSLPDAQGVDTVHRVHAASPDTPIIVMTSLDDENTAAQAMQAGAQDYLVKGGFDGNLLERAIRYAIERKRTVEALRRSEERYALAVRGTSDGVFDWDLVANRVYYSERWSEMIGLRDDPYDLPDQWLGRVHDEDRDRLNAAIEGYIASGAGAFEAEYRLLHADGAYRWMLARATAVRGADGKATRLVGSQSDITERKIRDPLTGLPNITLFNDRLSHVVARARRRADLEFAVLMIDLDRFKLINDSLGHSYGDELLVSVAERILRCVRAVDTVARVSADQFVVLLEEIRGPTLATRVAERIHSDLIGPIPLMGEDVHCSASIGIVFGTGSYTNSSQVMRDADTALHRAKKGTHYYQVFDETMHDATVRQLRVEMDLRQALERDELRLYYQPIVSVETGRVSGFEALVRWEHPRRGIVRPIEFIPIAEETGLIVEVGRWVLRQACEQAVKWQGLLGGLTLSVNLSASQFIEPTFVADFEGIIEAAGVDGRRLRFELTESTLLERPDTAALALRRLREHGVQVAIDDFGTGYSSLKYLHQLPIDTLKVDRTFVTGIEQEGEQRQIVRTIVMLAHALDLDVVAEGVENSAQLDQLRKLDCEYAQGYLFSEPVPADVAERLVRDQ